MKLSEVQFKCAGVDDGRITKLKQKLIDLGPDTVGWSLSAVNSGMVSFNGSHLEIYGFVAVYAAADTPEMTFDQVMQLLDKVETSKAALLSAIEDVISEYECEMYSEYNTAAENLESAVKAREALEILRKAEIKLK